MKVRNFEGVRNQFILEEPGKVIFQSYDSIIAIKQNGSITLDEGSWDYSTTTGKYRNRFLNETKKETEKKIKAGIYKLANLNGDKQNV